MNASTTDVPTEATLGRVVPYERVSYEDQRYWSQCVKRVLGLDRDNARNPLTIR